MTVDYKFKKGVHLPTWMYLSGFPAGASFHGGANTWDGVRYQYWVMQTGTTSAAASTTTLYKYDTWLNAWQMLSVTTSGGMGLDIEYDPVRNVVYIIHGAGLTTWQVYNLNLTAVTIFNVSCPAFALTTLTPVLPAVASYGASLTMPSDKDIPTQIDSGTADSTGNTISTVKATDATGTFGQGMVGLQVRVLIGAQAGQKRTISAVTDKNTFSVAPALGGALAAGDTFVIEPVEDTATAGATSTTLPDATASWITNQYADHDVIITGGTGNGQRRRIGSNTSTVLTLAAATTGNPRTGPWNTTPDATSTFKIVPSSDFLYYQPGNGSTALYRIDAATGANATAWSASLATAPAAIGPGSNTFFPQAYAPGYLMALRGAATSAVYLFNIGTKAWTTLTTFAGGETFTTGNNSCMLHGKRKLLVQKEGATRLYTYDLTTGLLEPFLTMPYAAPVAYDGKRARFVKTSDGVEWLYLMRAGGAEFYRVPLEWM